MSAIGTGAILLMLLTSCGINNVTLYPIEREDIMPMNEGVAYTPDRNGFFLSDDYIMRVMDAKID